MGVVLAFAAATVIAAATINTISISVLGVHRPPDGPQMDGLDGKFICRALALVLRLQTAFSSKCRRVAVARSLMVVGWVLLSMLSMR